MSIYYDVCDFGAVGDGKRNNAKAFQAAIDKCAEAGGGIVYLPPGNFMTGTIFLKDNVNLHLSGGAVITGSSNLNDYKGSEYSQSSKRDRTSGTHLIIAQDAENVSISGTGSIDGNALAFFGSEPGNSDRLTIKGEVRTSQMVIFCGCENVKVSDILFKNSPYWHLFIYGCRKVKIHGIRIKSNPDTFTNDGLDIDSSVDVVVSDCLIESQDDCITLRCSNNTLCNQQNCENISVTNCILRTDCCGVRVGVGDGKIKNAVFSNLVIENAGIGLDIIGRYTNAMEGTEIENIIFSNIVMHANVPFFVTPGYGATKPIKNISFRNIMAFAKSCSYLGGLPDVKSSEISMKDIKITIQPGIDNLPDKNDLLSGWAGKGYTEGANSINAPYGIWLEHLESCEFKDIRIIQEDQNDRWLNAVKINNVKSSRFESVAIKNPESFFDNLLSEAETDDFTLNTFTLNNFLIE